MVHLFRWDMIGTISCLSLLLCLCLYQLTLSTESLSFIRLSQFVFEFLAACAWFYYLCHCSDKLDECQSKLCRALYNSSWYQCSSRRTQRDLIVFMRRLQRSNMLKFNQGSLVLNKGLFVKSAKFAYSFVSCIRVRK
uniref:Uncharacterized protein n=1 Tax=Cacopsylla melanoneura TaxID=428564 RepID=A0A8D8QUR4_9HEMI